MRISLFLAISLLATAPVMAHKETDDAKGATDPNKVICKTEDVLGSRLQSEKRCMTAAQWAQARRDEHDNLESAQRSGGSGH